MQNNSIHQFMTLLSKKPTLHRDLINCSPFLGVSNQCSKLWGHMAFIGLALRTLCFIITFISCVGLSSFSHTNALSGPSVVLSRSWHLFPQTEGGEQERRTSLWQPLKTCKESMFVVLVNRTRSFTLVPVLPCLWRRTIFALLLPFWPQHRAKSQTRSQSSTCLDMSEHQKQTHLVSYSVS